MEMEEEAQDPFAYLRHMKAVFSPERDLDLLHSIQNNYTSLCQKSNSFHLESSSLFKELCANSEAMESYSKQREVEESTCRESLSTLQQQRDATIQSIQTLDLTIQELEVALHSLQNIEESLLEERLEDIAETSQKDAMLKLHMFRGLGIEVLPNHGDATPQIRIRSNAKNDIQTMVVRDTEMGNELIQRTNLIWELCE